MLRDDHMLPRQRHTKQRIILPVGDGCVHQSCTHVQSQCHLFCNHEATSCLRYRPGKSRPRGSRTTSRQGCRFACARGLPAIQQRTTATLNEFANDCGGPQTQAGRPHVRRTRAQQLLWHQWKLHRLYLTDSNARSGVTTRRGRRRHHRCTRKSTRTCRSTPPALRPCPPCPQTMRQSLCAVVVVVRGVRPTLVWGMLRGRRRRRKEGSGRGGYQVAIWSGWTC